MAKLSKLDYIKALRKLETSSSDKVGILGQLGIIGTGAAAGSLAAGSIATAAGVTTILGSSTLGSILGGVLIASTPIGWVVGTAAAGAVVAYGFSNLVQSGSKMDERKKLTIEEIRKKIKKYETDAKKNQDNEIQQLAGMYATLLENGIMNENEISAILEGIQNNQIDYKMAFDMANNIITEIEQNTISEKIDDSLFAVRSSFVILLKYLMHIDEKVTETERKAFFNIMKNEFGSSENLAKPFYKETPIIQNTIVHLVT
jgi:hypothetical protein